jgi:hypothetical protein
MNSINSSKYLNLLLSVKTDRNTVFSEDRGKDGGRREETMLIYQSENSDYAYL